MPRSRSGGRGGRTPSASSAAPPVDIFDDAWLTRIRERFDARHIDLTSASDRRRWHPSKLDSRYGLFGLRGPRIVVVPEGHRLARLQTYGGRYSLNDVRRMLRVGRSPHNRRWHDVREHDTGRIVRKYGFAREGVSRRLGFHLPWQVIVCVRRQRRKEVLHAFRIAGGGVGKGKRWRRGRFSDVRC